MTKCAIGSILLGIKTQLRVVWCTHLYVLPAAHCENQCTSSNALHAFRVLLFRPESVAAAAQEVAAAVGSTGLQLLVNNAGIGALAPAECVPLEDYK